MYIKSLKLENFRNYESETINFSPGTNIIYGNNANGKTNILEAVYLFGYGKSHRTKLDREMIRFKKEKAKATINFHTQDRNFEATISLSKDGKKNIVMNNVPVKKLSRLMSYFHAVIFSPEDLNLVKGSPSARRRYMDAALCRTYPGYFSALAEYKAIAQEKNVLLRQLRKKGKTQDDYLSVWNERLSIPAQKIINMRSEFIRDISEFAAKIQKDISSEELLMEYEQSIRFQSAKEIFEFLESNQKREIENGAMCFGIQRDDILLAINKNDARQFASQGQQRTAALSMRIAEADYIFSKTGEYPVLLLDDIFSELDITRRMYLWERITDKQVLITCTDTDLFENKNASKLFVVQDGCVKEEE